MSASVEVHGQFLNASRYPMHGTVIFSPCVPAPLGDDDSPVVVTNVPVTASLNSAGMFSVSLVASDDPGWHTDCDVVYEVDIRISGLRNSYHAIIPAPGPWDITDLIRLDAPPNVATVPTPGPPGPAGAPGAGVQAYVTDLGAVAAGVPTVISHGLGTFDVATDVILKDNPAPGAGAGHLVEADVSAISPDEVQVTFDGSMLPLTPGSFRVSVRAVTPMEAVA